MSKRTQTVVTLHVRLTIPPNSNVAEVIAELRSEISQNQLLASPDAVVKLVKKETSYV